MKASGILAAALGIMATSMQSTSFAPAFGGYGGNYMARKPRSQAGAKLDRKASNGRLGMATIR